MSKKDAPERYARQAVFPPIGADGQRSLLESSVVVVGCGALGSSSASLLVRAGVGDVKIIDRDVVDLSNLHRQLLYEEDDVAGGLPKAEIARRKLQAANRTVRVRSSAIDLGPSNALQELSGFRVIIDGCDNFETRYLINDAAVRLGTPWVYGGVIGGGGMAMAVVPGRTACLRCLFPEPPVPGEVETCDTAGVIGPAPAAVGALQAAMAMRLLTGATEDPPVGALIRFDVWNGTFGRIESAVPDPSCPACSASGRLEFLEGDRATRSATLCGRDAVQVFPPHSLSMDLQTIAGRLTALSAVHVVSVNSHLLRIREGGLEAAVFPDGRVIVSGTEDPATARSLCARLIGH